jgi:hypothetical protein
VAAFASLTHGFVHAVKLQQFAVSLADFSFNVAGPEIGRETERAAWLFG